MYCARLCAFVSPRQGFDTTFTFRLSSPSLRCNTMDGVYTHCRSRGADGVAFVVQGEGPTALGRGGMVRGREGEKGVRHGGADKNLTNKKLMDHSEDTI